MSINWKQFILAGKAIFTIENTLTNNRFTFRVKKHKHKELWFVSVLRGTDNTSDYSYMGCISEKGFRHTKNSKVTPDCTSFKAFGWFYKLLLQNKPIPDSVKIYHAGRCCRCGRLLTVPESITSGIGPECAVIMQGVKYAS